MLVSKAMRVIGWTCCAVLLSSGMALAGKHYSARLSGGNFITSPDIHKIVFSPDGSRLIVSTSRGTHIVQSKGATLLGKLDFTPFSVAYSRDGSRAFMISTRSRKLLDMELGTAIEYDAGTTAGFIGLTIDRKNGKLLVTAIDPGGPVDQNGQIHVGDELISVGAGRNGEMKSVIGKSVQPAIESMKGPAGAYLRLGVIPDGEIKEQFHLLRRQVRRQVNGQVTYLPFEGANIDDNVAWCMSNGNHEFSSARTGKVVSTLRTHNIPNENGFPVISPDSTRFAFVGRYINPPQNLRKPQDKPSDSTPPEKNVPKITRSVVDSTRDSVESGKLDSGVFGVEIFDIASQELVTTFPIDHEPVNTVVPVAAFYGVRFSPDGKQLITGTWSTIHIYDIATGNKVKEFKVPGEDSSRIVEKLAVSDGLVAVGNLEGVVSLFDIRTGQLVTKIESREQENVAELEFSNDGNWLAYVVKGVLHVVDVSDVNGTGAK